jgi:DNA-binding NarL/FixJ family response regulator
MTAGCRVLIADDQTMLRAGIRFALEADGFDVVAETSRGDDAIALAERMRPDLCLVDVLIPHGAVRVIRELRRTVPDALVVVLATSVSDDDLFTMLIAGASGLLPKETPSDRLAPTLRGVLAGQAALTRRMTATLIREFRGCRRQTRVARDRALSAGQLLTDREAEVLELLANGNATSQIAGELRISDVTVRRHVSTIVRKIGAADRSAAVRMVLQGRKARA